MLSAISTFNTYECTPLYLLRAAWFSCCRLHGAPLTLSLYCAKCALLFILFLLCFIIFIFIIKCLHTFYIILHATTGIKTELREHWYLFLISSIRRETPYVRQQWFSHHAVQCCLEGRRSAYQGGWARLVAGDIQKETSKPWVCGGAQAPTTFVAIYKLIYKI
jgi:predicted membrane protein